MRGFSLVELSIVLVILGLLTGGILTGQTLIRAAELRAVTTEYQNYLSATQTFRSKYFALPGDFRDATRFWSRQINAAHCVTNSSAAVVTSGSCDGNGDGILDNASAASQSGENFQFWRHLALAGLVENTYTGLAASNGAEHHVIGSNCPRSKLSSGGWGAEHTGQYSGSGNAYALDYGTELYLGAETASTFNTGAVLSPEDAWNIDTKMDDGLPAQGKTIAFDSAGFGTATACTTSADQNDLDGTYNLTNTAIACSLFFIRQF